MQTEAKAGRASTRRCGFEGKLCSEPMDTEVLAEADKTCTSNQRFPFERSTNGFCFLSAENGLELKKSEHTERKPAANAASLLLPQ